MAEERAAEGSQASLNLLEENLFELQCLIRASEIYHSAHCEIGTKQLLAFATRNTDIGFYYLKEASSLPIIKRIPWFQAPQKAIAALCFDPSGSWLLVASVDGLLCIVPALALVDSSSTVNQKWATNDITSFTSLNSQSSYSRPSALVWWQGVIQSNDIAIIGTEHGEIVLVDLESRKQVGLTHVKGNVSSLHICQDNSLDVVSLLITNQSRQQWRLILEQRTNGYVYPLNSDKSFHPSYPLPNTNSNPNNEIKTLPATRSRLQGLKQLSVEKLAMLKQKLAETRSRSLAGPILRRDSSSSSGTEEIIQVASSKTCSEASADSLSPEPVSQDMFLAPQYTRQGQHLYTGYHSPTNHLTIHGTDVSVVPLYIHKMPPLSEDILLTQRLFYITDVQRQSLYIVSCPLSESRMEGEANFNQDSVIGHFSFESTKEFINRVYRLTDFKAKKPKKVPTETENRDALPKKVEDLNVDVPLVDTCIVVTNFAVYRVVLRKSLLTVFMDLVLQRKEVDKASRLALVFGMNVQQLLEYAGDILLSNKEFSQAVVLYKLSKCRLLKSVLKFAAAGHTSELLSCVTHCLTPPSVSELPTATRIHLSNLSVLAFTELTLRNSSQQLKHIHKDFLNFLSTNIFYDELLAINIAGQTGLWKILHHLATQRGLYAEVLDILLKAVQAFNSNNSNLLPCQSKYGLLICLSEPSLIQALLANHGLARSHMTFVSTNLTSLQIFVLQRLISLYDPTNVILRPLLIRCRARRRTTSRSSQSSQCDSLDMSEMLEETGTLLEEFIQTFLMILLTLIHKRTLHLCYNPILMRQIQLPGIEKDRDNISTNVDFRRRLLSAGFSHVALIRNGNVYTWGNAVQGCLGTGPSVIKYGPPQAVSLFKCMEVEVFSVSCGKCHSLAVTNNGVYVWGANKFGQLGLGKIVQCPSPELVSSLAQEVIVDAVAGQYHSVALTMDGRLFTWGWGVHGQLGHGNTEEKNVPTLVTSLLGIVIRHISAGHAHTMTLSADGHIYIFGSNVFGQLGNGTNNKSSLPVKVSLIPEKIMLISTGYFHNLAVSHTNKLYTWGASPQVLRLQAQAQKKSRILQQAALEKKFENLESERYDGRDNVDSKAELDQNDAQNSDTVQTKDGTTSTILMQGNLANGTRFPKSPSFRSMNIGLLEEAQTHMKPSLVDTSLVNGQIVQISTGCHHSALLTKDGSLYTWGLNLDGQIGNGTRRVVAIPTPLGYNPASILAQVPPRTNVFRGEERSVTSDTDNTNFENAQKNTDNISNFEATNYSERTDRSMINHTIKTIRVCCGSDYTVAVQPGGTVLAWGGNSMAQLGRPPAKDSRASDEKLVLLKSSRRIVRLPHAAHTAMDTPSQVPNIPTPIITYQSYDITPLAGLVRPLSVVEKVPSELTLHYVLEQFNGLYDSEKIMNKCLEMGNYQACSKLALLDRNFSEALSYQLKALNSSYLKPRENTSASKSELQEEQTDPNKDFANDESSLVKSMSQIKLVKENTELFDRHVEKNIVETLEECEAMNTTKMSTSRSLDSFRILEQELHTFNCQGGSEELCDDAKSEDISLDITEDALDDDTEANNSAVSISNVISGNDDGATSSNHDKDCKNSSEIVNTSGVMKKMEDLCSETAIRSVYKDHMGNQENYKVHEASSIVKFYMNEIEEESHSMMCEVLRSALDFWIKYNLPMQHLENVLLEHMNKLFYPLGLLLFCQNKLDENIDTNKKDGEGKSLAMMNSLSTKFCLQVCSMLLRHIGQGSSENQTPEQMMEGVMSTLTSDPYGPKPYIHIKDPEEVSRFLSQEEDTMVFTCGHYFPISNYQSEAVPTMEAELLMSEQVSLPCTAELLGNVMTESSKVETLCPLCIPRALQTVVKDMVEQ
ncbi:uncharacterized protein LOC107263725 isoform X2 [Cephus cinctus]|uniref:Uncharacterized protein LOC107263725 isoform X2 n=1 Tax=Cephus cinctus TaxID=211228 RepID=A0AAJ7RAB3_CEPCN|nr:uncharacterized protein LOC107263725 isoform X2 [Cephus cinctus]